MPILRWRRAREVRWQTLPTACCKLSCSLFGVLANHCYYGAETQSASPFEELSVTADCEMLANRPGPWPQSLIFVL